MSMLKVEVQGRLCALARDVMDKKFGFRKAADCFCGANGADSNPMHFQFDPEVLKFIEDAVRKALDGCA